MYFKALNSEHSCSQFLLFCCIIMPAWIVSLFFFPKHFYCCVLPYVYITTRVTLELKSPAMGILYSSCSLRYESGLNYWVGHSGA